MIPPRVGLPQGRGVTLMELLVAMALTGFVTWMAMSLFSNENRSYTKTRERVRLQSDSREALRLMEDELRNTGFRTTVATSASRTTGTVDTCTDVLLAPGSGDSSSFGFGNSTSLSGDSITFLFHEPQNGVLSSCANLRTIAYRQSGSQIQRRWCSGTCTTEPWIPLLDSVVTFQIRYGVAIRQPDTSSGFPQANLQNWAKWTLGTLVESGSSPAVNIGGWTTAAQGSIFQTAIDTLDPLQTWEIDFTATPNAAFLSDYDSTSLRIGFFKSDGTVSAAGDTTTFYPGSTGGASRQCSIRIAPATASIAGRYLGIQGKLRATTSSGWSLSISNLTIQRVGRGRLQWMESPTVSQKNKVRAIKLHVLAKAHSATEAAYGGTFDSASLGQSGLSYTPSGVDAKRSFILFQRIIPVVNNGT